MDDNKTIVLGILILCVGAVGITWAAVWYNATVTTEAMRNGYEQGSVPGQNGAHWIKKKAE